MAVVYRITPTNSPNRVRFIQACVGLFSLMTRRHRLYVAEHAGKFAGSLLHRGDWNHEEV